MRILFFLLLSTTTFAQTIITDRPDQTESSSTIPLKSFQIESGFQLGLLGNEPRKEYSAPTVLLRYGVLSWLELRANGTLFTLENNSQENDPTGFSDLEIGTKIQILRNKNINTEIAFLTHVILPIGSRNFTNNQFGSINKLSISHEITNCISLGYNIGYNFFGQDFGDFTYSLALGFKLSKKWGFYIEPFGDVVNFDTHLSSADAGFTYLLKDNLQFDFSYGYGLNYSMQYFSAGASWNFR